MCAIGSKLAETGDPDLHTEEREISAWNSVQKTPYFHVKAPEIAV